MLIRDAFKFGMNLMWISFTKEEAARQHRQRIFRASLSATFVWLVIAIATAAFWGWGERPSPAEFWVGWPDFWSRLWLRLLIGGLAIWCLPWASRLRRRRSWACESCGAIQADPGSIRCQCGGSFIDVTDMRWVECADAPSQMG